MNVRKSIDMQWNLVNDTKETVKINTNTYGMETLSDEEKEIVLKRKNEATNPVLSESKWQLSDLWEKVTGTNLEQSIRVKAFNLAKNTLKITSPIDVSSFEAEIKKYQKSHNIEDDWKIGRETFMEMKAGVVLEKAQKGTNILPAIQKEILFVLQNWNTEWKNYQKLFKLSSDAINKHNNDTEYKILAEWLPKSIQNNAYVNNKENQKALWKKGENWNSFWLDVAEAIEWNKEWGEVFNDKRMWQLKWIAIFALVLGAIFGKPESVFGKGIMKDWYMRIPVIMWFFALWWDDLLWYWIDKMTEKWKEFFGWPDSAWENASNKIATFFKENFNFDSEQSEKALNAAKTSLKAKNVNNWGDKLDDNKFNVLSGVFLSNTQLLNEKISDLSWFAKVNWSKFSEGETEVFNKADIKDKDLLYFVSLLNKNNDAYKNKTLWEYLASFNVVASINTAATEVVSTPLVVWTTSSLPEIEKPNEENLEKTRQSLIIERSNFTVEIKSKEDEILKLKTKISGVWAREEDKLESQIKIIEKQIEELKQKQQELENKIEDTERKIKEWEISEVNKKVVKFNKEFENINKYFTDYSNDFNEISEWKAWTLNEVKAELSKLDALEEEIKLWNSTEIESLKVNISTLRWKTSNLKSKLRDEIVTYYKLNQEILDKKDRIDFSIENFEGTYPNLITYFTSKKLDELKISNVVTTFNLTFSNKKSFNEVKEKYEEVIEKKVKQAWINSEEKKWLLIIANALKLKIKDYTSTLNSELLESKEKEEKIKSATTTINEFAKYLQIRWNKIDLSSEPDALINNTNEYKKLDKTIITDSDIIELIKNIDTSLLEMKTFLIENKNINLKEISEDRKNRKQNLDKFKKLYEVFWLKNEIKENIIVKTIEAKIFLNNFAKKVNKLKNRKDKIIDFDADVIEFNKIINNKEGELYNNLSDYHNDTIRDLKVYIKNIGTPEKKAIERVKTLTKLSEIKELIKKNPKAKGEIIEVILNRKIGSINEVKEIFNKNTFNDSKISFILDAKDTFKGKKDIEIIYNKLIDLLEKNNIESKKYTKFNTKEDNEGVILKNNLNSWTHSKEVSYNNIDYTIEWYDKDWFWVKSENNEFWNILDIEEFKININNEIFTGIIKDTGEKIVFSMDEVTRFFNWESINSTKINMIKEGNKIRISNISGTWYILITK